jgi:transcriptional regulator with XRE-family HTH domain
MKIPELLKCWRKFHDLTMRQMSEQLGITLPTYDRIEKGGDFNLKTYLAIRRWMEED